MNRKGAWGEYELLDVVEIEIATLDVRVNLGVALDLFLATILGDYQFRLSALG
jgi:hypothetical protein